MGGPTEPQAALVSIEDQGAIMALLDIQRDPIGFKELSKPFAQTQEKLMKVAQYSQPIWEMQMVCDHSQQIVNLQWEITDLQTKQFLPPYCDHLKMEQPIQTRTNERDEARRRPAATRTDQALQEELVVMTRNAQQSGEEICSFRTQLANASTLGARAAQAAPQAPEDRG